jgi:hypothetical protein
MEITWLWGFVYHIKGHAIAHKYNLNPNKNILSNNQHDIKFSSISKNSID